nr:immunoglobulin heavy chain junction region [Mus musculus]
CARRRTVYYAMDYW